MAVSEIIESAGRDEWDNGNMITKRQGVAPVILSAFLVGAGAPDSALPPEPKQESAPDAQSEKVVPIRAPREASRTIRERKTASVHGVIGLAVFPVFAPSFGVAGSAFLGPQNLVEASFSKANSWEWYNKDQVTFNTVHFSAGYKRFVGNSLFVGGNAAYRLSTARHDAFFGFGKNKFDRNYTTAGAELTAGNRWQWRAFSLGVDWLTFYVPVSRSAANVSRASWETLSDEERAVFEHRSDKRVFSNELRIALVIGASL